MPREFEDFELRPVKEGFCHLCGNLWHTKPGNSLPEYLKYGVWELAGFQVLQRGSRKKTILLCNDCLSLVHLTSMEVMRAHLKWLDQELKVADAEGRRPRISEVGYHLLMDYRKRLQKELGPKNSWFAGKCTLCTFPVVVTQPDAELFPHADYWWYCSNPKCERHSPGTHTDDMEQPEWVQLSEV